MGGVEGRGVKENRRTGVEIRLLNVATLKTIIKNYGFW